MLTQIINGRILTPQGWLKDGSVLICDGKILEVTNSDLAVIGATVIDARGMTIVPGFVSMHAHGGGGHDFTEATEEAFRMATTAHLKHGATSMFPTLSSTSFEKLYQAVDVCEGLMQEPDSPILGLHIEGPYLNPKMAGSQYEGFLKTPDENEYIPLLEHTTCIKRWDISPELRGAHDFAKYTRSKGIMTAVTHTEAEYDEIKAAYAVGFSHAAHFYNAMPGFHKRREYKYEGTVESVYLTDGMTVEVIADGIHLPATILKLVYKLKGVENTCLVTDALAYAAYEGHEPIDSRYIIEDGVCKMADHSALAGSLATMDVLVRTMVKKANIPLEDAVRMASETPARLIGVSDRKGALAKGLDADIVILDKELNAGRGNHAGPAPRDRPVRAQARAGGGAGGTGARGGGGVRPRRRRRAWRRGLRPLTINQTKEGRLRWRFRRSGNGSTRRTSSWCRRLPSACARRATSPTTSASMACPYGTRRASAR